MSRSRWAILLATGLLVAAGSWIAVRTVAPADGAPLLTDYGFARGFTLSPLPSDPTPLRQGDVVVAIEGTPIDDVLSGDYLPMPPLRAGAVWRYRVLREGETRDVVVHLRRGGPFVSERLRNGAPILLVGLALTLIGGWTVFRRTGHAASRALLILGAGFTAYTLFQALSTDVAALPAARWMFVAGVVGHVGSLGLWSTALTNLALSFPEPVAPLRRHPWLAPVVYVGVLIGFAVVPAGYIVSGAAGLSGLDGLYTAMQVTLYALVVLALFGLLRTMWRSIRDPLVRRQGALVALGMATTLIVVLFANVFAGDQELPPWFGAVAFLPMPVALATAIVRGEFLDLRATINRALVFSALTGSLLVLYAAVVAVLGTVVGRSGLAATLPATGVVAVAFSPLRAGLQRLVDRIIYGHRGDPERILADLGRRLEAALPVDEVLPVCAETVAVALRLPYVGIRTSVGDSGRLACERGEPPEDPERIALLHQGRLVGELLVGPRRGQRALTPDDRTALGDVARHVASAVDASRLVTELSASRSRLAIAREEERAQLRHDLHDRLGSHLVGLTLLLDTLEAHATEVSSTEGIRRAHAEAERALDEVRRISRGLRPAELDELGLVAAINSAAARLTIGGDANAWVVTVDAAVQLPDIAPTVASAAYHIAVEALTNAIRHSGGRSARVRVGVTSSGSRLTVEVSDDGAGIEGDTTEGVGLDSMSARAERVGGRLEIESGAGRGTVVRVDLPLGAEAVGSRL